MTLGAPPHEYAPQTVSPPGETLKETLEELGISQADLARHTGLSTKHVNQIVQGTAALSPETALLLERTTGVPATVWNTLEAAWRTQLVRQAEHEALTDQIGWLDKFPLADLVARGVLPDRGKTVANLRQLLDFFGVASPAVAEDLWSGYSTAFRRSTTTPPNEYATYAWLRLGVLEARRRPCMPYQREALHDLLPELRALSSQEPELWLTRLPALCATAGVAVIFSPAFKNTSLSGATRWLSPDKVMIALTDRHKKDDRFWFTVFHEVGHVLLHGKRLTFLDDDPFNGTSTAEEEANAFASQILIPPAHAPAYETLRRRPRPFTNIQRFAEQAGIAPGIVVGRLQYDKALDWSEGNKLKRGFDLTAFTTVQNTKATE
ncbi:HigA family addiction module antitoxin [Actinacidiphila oryziradicis]|uniref:Addiction module antidote protein, HigA family n=1 Tax=Actinacidiphila oryziradicis TaxID=2571141 RepID=A0A4U0SJP1_9ACTN|nr:HigA family addiction module antitoxin [Actinacidiphila oryziradicis]TKA00495.1 addiction module antidote protein, HigA family [Actinacidiphila oryziradicis]